MGLRGGGGPFRHPDSLDFQLVSRSHLQCSCRITRVLVLLKYLILLLKRFPSFTSWALSGGSHNPSSDLNEGKVGQWPAVFFLQNDENLSHQPNLKCWGLEMKKKRNQMCYLSYSWLLNSSLLGVSEKSPVLKVVTNASFCLPPLRDTPLTHLPAWTACGYYEDKVDQTKLTKSLWPNLISLY